MSVRQGRAATSDNGLGRAVGLAEGAPHHCVGAKEHLPIWIQSRVRNPLPSRAVRRRRVSRSARYGTADTTAAAA